MGGAQSRRGLLGPSSTPNPLLSTVLHFTPGLSACAVTAHCPTSPVCFLFRFYCS
ncbi:hypothetical protein DPEC_G00224660 [Dallia pectoralis]|uniref:Uncharacterized protein n=1 Tax=Dallia pectoralis TaxID=75939 RepID=A0ACC2FZX1_DALPE|nr:hypothetical protein DPEC_G00224660 [Dallia pectoralis]